MAVGACTNTGPARGRGLGSGLEVWLGTKAPKLPNVLAREDWRKCRLASGRQLGVEGRGNQKRKPTELGFRITHSPTRLC